MTERKKNIVLIGMPGTGKSSVGKVLATKTDKELIDCDTRIEHECGIRISEIFSDFGEQYFRNVETRVVKGAAKKDNAIISCGGGVVLKDENMLSLKENGFIVWLRAEPKNIYDRIKNNSLRPLISKKDGAEGIAATYQTRKPLYEKYSDFSIDVDNLTVDNIADIILKNLPQ